MYQPKIENGICGGLILTTNVDHRSILKEVRRKRKMTASKMADLMNVHLNTAHYSRVENCEANISVEQFFEVCRVLNVNPEAVFNHGQEIQDIDDLNVNKIGCNDAPLECLEIQDDSMAKGKSFGIYKNSLVWYLPTKHAPSNSLVIVEGKEEKRFVRELISDLGKDRLRAWNSDYDTVDLDDSFKIIGMVKDVNYKPC